MDENVPFSKLVQDVDDILWRHRESLSVAEIEALELAKQCISQVAAQEKKHISRFERELFSFAIELLMKFFFGEF